MTPFNFTGAKEAVVEELRRFGEEAARVKPPSFNQEYRTRLDFYLHRQTEHVRAILKQRYPETHKDVEPYLETLRITPFFVDEQAKVFLNGAGLELVGKDGQAVKADSPESMRWRVVQEEAGIGLKLKLVDRYTVLFRTCFLRLDRVDKGPLRAHIFFPQDVDVVFDPAHPFDLDRAHGVRLRVGGDGASARYEFWCARPGEEQYRILNGDGTVEQVEGNADGANPYRDAEGNAIVPLVMFTLHAEELGAFTDAGQGLHLFNQALDVMLTDVHHIAAVQGFGQLAITYKVGLGPSGTKLVASPTRALELRDGATAEVLSPSPQISSLLEMIDSDVKRQAMTHGIPPGSVSLDARAVASGIALTIEMRPLFEKRTDAIDFYRAPMKRVWRIARIVLDARRVDGETSLSGLEARWTPGDVYLPADEGERVDNLLARKNARLISRVEAIAEDRGISKEEATRVAAEIDAENADAADPLAEDVLGLGRKKASLDAEEPEGDEPPAPAPAGGPVEPPPGTKAAEVDQLAVDPTTALNGAQVTALLEVVGQAARGEIPRQTALEIIVAAFPVTRGQAEKILGPVGTPSFTPPETGGQAPAPPPPPEPPAPPPAE